MLNGYTNLPTSCNHCFVNRRHLEQCEVVLKWLDYAQYTFRPTALPVTAKLGLRGICIVAQDVCQGFVEDRQCERTIIGSGTEFWGWDGNEERQVGGAERKDLATFACSILDAISYFVTMIMCFRKQQQIAVLLSSLLRRTLGGS